MSGITCETGEPLTAREFEVMGRYARLGVMKLVADEMGITTGSVKSHVVNVYRKLDVSGMGAIAAFHALGWLHVPGDAEIRLYGAREGARLVEIKLRHLRTEVDRLIEQVAA